MYSKAHSIVIGFHGCDRATRDAIVAGEKMKPSSNDYDWLGSGLYFWENNLTRAMEFAKEKQQRDSTLKEPAVLGAVIDLGKCLDLTDSANLPLLRGSYKALVNIHKATNKPLPKNKTVGTSFDLLKRDLDCAVINTLHELRQAVGKDSFDSVRGVFWEGEELYPGAGFKEKNHIQICVRNVNCIKAFFKPRELDILYPIP